MAMATRALSIGIAHGPLVVGDLRGIAVTVGSPQPEDGLRRNNSDSFGRYGEAFAASGPLLALPIQDGLLA